MADEPEPIMSVTEWENLLAALRTIVERYSIEAVEDAVDHLKNTGKV